MREYIALDSHKHYSLAEREDVRTGRACQERIEPGATVWLRQAAIRYRASIMACLRQTMAGCHGCAAQQPCLPAL